MNTNVKIKTCTRSSAGAKVGYNEERKKQMEKDISIFAKEDIPEILSLSDDDKKEIQALQRKISQSQKRLEKAIEDGKEKSIQTNQKNIDEAKAKLEAFGSRKDSREKPFVELTLSLTNFKNWQDDLNRAEFEKACLDFAKKEFPNMSVISGAAHYDQASPHAHVLLFAKEKSWSATIVKRGVKLGRIS